MADVDKRVPVSLTSFRDHVEKLHADENKEFQLEFEVAVRLNVSVLDCLHHSCSY